MVSGLHLNFKCIKKKEKDILPGSKYIWFMEVKVVLRLKNV